MSKFCFHTMFYNCLSAGRVLGSVKVKTGRTYRHFERSGPELELELLCVLRYISEQMVESKQLTLGVHHM